MDLKEYMRLKKQIEDKSKQELDALEMLWRAYGSKDSGSSDSQKKPVLAESIREVIKAIGGQFSVNEVANGLKNLGHHDIETTQLSNALNRLARRNEIIAVEKGKGRTPSVYIQGTGIPKNAPTEDTDFLDL